MIIKRDPDVDDVRGVEIDTIEYDETEFKLYLMDGNVLRVNITNEETLEVYMEKAE